MTDNVKQRRLAPPFDSYSIYSDGRVFSHHSNKFLAPFMINSGYQMVHLYYNNEDHRQLVHRLVATYFVPNPNIFDVVNHIDGNRLNNNYTNLEWTSQKNNLFEAQKMNLMKDRSESPYEICNFKTGESYLFTNYKEALLYLGLQPSKYCYNESLRNRIKNDSTGEYFLIPRTDWMMRKHIDSLITDFAWSL